MIAIAFSLPIFCDFLGLTLSRARKHGIRFVPKKGPVLITSYCVREFIPFISLELFQKQIFFDDSFSSIGFTQIMRYPSSHELLHSEITQQNSFDYLVRRRKSYYENPSRKTWFVAQSIIIAPDSSVGGLPGLTRSSIEKSPALNFRHQYLQTSTETACPFFLGTSRIKVPWK
jgi:hypothetical protein